MYWLLLFICNGFSFTLDDDRNALLDLYNQCGGPGWSPPYNNWTSDNPCDFEGVKCNNSRVSFFCLPRNGASYRLIGSLPATMANLDALEHFELENSRLSGSLQIIGKLTKLTALLIGGTPLEGSFSFVEGLTALIELQMPAVQVTGSFNSISYLTNLQKLSLSETHLSGSLDSLQALNLETLAIRETRIEGSLVSLQKFTRLWYLDLGNTLVGGSLSALRNLTALSYLIDLRKTNVTGTLADLQMLVYCRTLNLVSTQVTGDIAPIKHLMNVQRVLLDDTSVSGNLESFQDLPELLELSLSRTQISGNLSALSTLTNLTGLVMESLSLNGSISPALCALSSLSSLRLSNNSFTSIPNCIFPSLRLLDLSNNQLRGVPDQFWNSPNLTYLNLAGNLLKGANLRTYVKGSLVSLTLSNNPLAIDAASFFSWTAILGSVSTLLLRNCDLFDGFEDLSAKLPSVSQLDVSQNPRLFASLQDLAELCPVLEVANISQTQIKLDTLTAVLMSTWPLRELDASNRSGARDCLTFPILQLNFLRILDIRHLTPCLFTNEFVKNDLSAQVRYDGNLSCPQRLTLISGGRIETDVSFMNRKGCSCPDQYWFDSQSLTCKPCPANIKCDPFVKGTLHEVQGSFYPWYKNSLAMNKSLFPLSVALPCRTPTDCNVAATEGFFCQVGRAPESLLCSRCASNFFPLQGECAPCTTEEAYISVVPLVLLILFYFWYSSRERLDPEAKSSAVLSICFFGLQLLDILEKSSPRSAQATPAWIQLPKELLSFRPWAFECVNDKLGFEFYFWVRLLVPLVFGFMWLLSVLFLKQCSNYSTQTRFKAVLVSVVEVAYLPLTTNALSILRCESPTDGLSYLTAAPYVNCNDAMMPWMMVCGVLGVCIYGLGIPFYFTFRLFRYRQNLSNSSVADLGALFATLRESSYAWIVPASLMARKFLVAVIVTQLSPQDAALPIVLSVLLVFLVVVQVNIAPYLRRRENVIEIAVLLSCWVVFQIRILQVDDVPQCSMSRPTDRFALTAVQMTVLISLYVLIAFYVAKPAVAKCCRCRQKPQDQFSGSMPLVKDLQVPLIDRSTRL